MKIKTSKVQLILEVVQEFLSGLDSNNNGWIETAELAEGLIKVLRRTKMPWYAKVLVQKPLLALLIDQVASLVPTPEAVRILQNPNNKKPLEKEETVPGEQTEPEKSRTFEKLQSLASADFLEKAIQANQLFGQKQVS